MNAHLDILAATVNTRIATMSALNALAQEVCANLDTIGAHLFDTGTGGVLVTVQLRSVDAVRAFAAERGLTVEATSTDVDWAHVTQVHHIHADLNAVEGGVLRIIACEFVPRPAVEAEAESTEAVA